MISPAAELAQGPVLLFDGVCTVCNASVQWVLRHERGPELRFAALQSAYAQSLIALHQQQPASLDSVVFYHKGLLYQRSEAALHLVPYLRWYWQWLRVGWLVPSVLRNAGYDWIARNRYHWFGQRQSCMVPSAELRTRFID